MTRLYEDVLELEEVTRADIQALKDNPKNYLAVSTSKGKTRYVQGEFKRAYDYENGKVKIGNPEFQRFVMWDGRRNTSLSYELLRVFDHEAYMKHINRKQELKRKHEEKLQGAQAVKVGDVFGGSWGYDATLWNFYQVTKVSASGKTVWVRELCHETASGYGPCDWKCRPAINEFLAGEPEQKHLVQYTQWGKDEVKAYIKINSYCHAYFMNDVEKWQSADNYH